jgi:hypothetical protein
MSDPAKENFIVDETGKPTAVILNIETYRKMVALIQERLDRKESKLLSQSKQFRKLVQKVKRDQGRQSKSLEGSLR